MNEKPTKKRRKYTKRKKSPKVQTIVKEIVKEIIRTIPEQKLTGYILYKTLADKGFPQGGQGTHVMNEAGTQLAYVPSPAELYNSFIQDPEGWKTLVDALAREWIELHN